MKKFAELAKLERINPLSVAGQELKNTECNQSARAEFSVFSNLPDMSRYKLS